MSLDCCGLSDCLCMYVLYVKMLVLEFNIMQKNLFLPTM